MEQDTTENNLTSNKTNEEPTTTEPECTTNTSEKNPDESLAPIKIIEEITPPLTANDATEKTEPSINNELSKSSTSLNKETTTRSKSPLTQPNCILFYGVTYLGCATVNAPKSEPEINRIMSTLNEQGKMAIEVTMSVPQSIEEKIVLFEMEQTKIAEYKMSHVLFVVRGGKGTDRKSVV